MTDEVDAALATYEDLMDLERDFDEAETEILRQQVLLTKPLYERREKIVAKIPNFWALVFEQAPDDLSQFVQHTDSQLLLSSLKSISVSHFEIENNGKGDPRNVSIKMEFDENEWFEDKVLEKKFWHRQSKDGDAGLVSEPVPIKWKSPEKDLTQGMLDLVIKIWEAEKKEGKKVDSSKPKKEKDYTPDEKALQQKINATGRGSASFFAWFGFIGMKVSEEESQLAIAEEKKHRADRAAGKVPELKEADEEDEDDEDDEEDPFGLEVFPEGDEVAIEISDDLWPNAIKYFTQAQEVDVSEMDFEDDDEDEEMDDGEEKPKTNGTQPPSKKRKA